VENRGVGEREYQTKVGDLGEASVITVSIVGSSGSVVRESVTIIPAEVHLVWEADSYTPTFYRGKALASHQSEVRVIAIPNLIDTRGRKLGSSSLSYNWSLDGKLDRDRSGVGRDVYSFNGYLVSRPVTVSLLIKSAGGSISASKSVVVNFVEPEILIYKENPLTGIKSNSSLKLGTVQGGESTFIAEPYFFSRKALDKGLLEYEWIADNRRLEELRGQKEIVFSSDVIGRSSVSVRVSNPLSLLQIAESLFRVVVSE